MHIFFEPTLNDRAWVVPLLRQEGLPLCDYSFPVLYCWRNTYRTRLARLENRVLVRLELSHRPAYLWPAGAGDPTSALELLRADAAAQGEPLRLMCLTEAHTDWLQARWPGQFVLHPLRDAANYLYRTDRLADLPGKKLHAKRNHIHRFQEVCPDWTCFPLTDADTPDCLSMEEVWYAARQREDGLSAPLGEHRALTEALTHRETLGLEGIVLRQGNQLLAFALGAPLTETVFDVHFERASEQIPGAYAAVNCAFARYVRAAYPQNEFLNREDDMGLAGLRQAKLSYHPDHLLLSICAAETATEI